MVYEGHTMRNENCTMCKAVRKVIDKDRVSKSRPKFLNHQGYRNNTLGCAFFLSVIGGLVFSLFKIKRKFIREIKRNKE